MTVEKTNIYSIQLSLCQVLSDSLTSPWTVNLTTLQFTQINERIHILYLFGILKKREKFGEL